MNKRLLAAKRHLGEGASLAIVNGGGELVFNEHGIKALLTLQTGSIRGGFAADKVVGMAAATLLVRGGIVEVYAEVISSPAYEFFKQHHVLCLYGQIVPNILSPDGESVCKMEQAVMGMTDVAEAYNALCEAFEIEAE